MKKEEDLKKVEDLIVKFDEPGESVYGILVAKERGHNYGNEVYKIKRPDDTIVTIFSTAVLESKMAVVKVGDTVKIEYTGTKENPKAGQNDIKQFEVYS